MHLDACERFVAVVVAVVVAVLGNSGTKSLSCWVTNVVWWMVLGKATRDARPGGCYRDGELLRLIATAFAFSLARVEGSLSHWLLHVCSLSQKLSWKRTSTASRFSSSALNPWTLLRCLWTMTQVCTHSMWAQADTQMQLHSLRLTEL